MNLLCEIRRDLQGHEEVFPSIQLEIRANFRIKATFPHVFEGPEQRFFAFSGSVQLVHVGGLFCCELAVYFQPQNLNIFQDHHPIWNLILFPEGV